MVFDPRSIGDHLPVVRGGLGGKSGPGVTVRPAHSIHGAVHGALPTQYPARCPLNASHVSTTVSGLLGKILIHLTLFWMITKKLYHICLFFNPLIHKLCKPLLRHNMGQK